MFLLFLVLGIKPRFSQMLGKHYSAELPPPRLVSMFQIQHSPETGLMFRGQEHVQFLQRTEVQFPAPVWQLTNVCDSSHRKSILSLASTSCTYIYT